MTLLDPSPTRWAGHALFLLRVIAGLIFVTAGTAKLFGFPSGDPPMPTVPLLSQAGVGGVLEVVGGLAVVVGLATRPVAFVLSGEMAVAYFQFHAPASFFPTVNQGVPAVLYCFLFLYLTFAGPGAWSLDGWRARRSAARAGG